MFIIECKLIVSEGRNRQFVRKIKQVILSTPGCELAYIDTHWRRNYIEVSFFGEPEAVLGGSYKIVALAEKEIDIRDPKKDPLRIGVVDSVLISPISGLDLSECAALSRELGYRVARTLKIPIYFYGSDVNGQEHRKVSDVQHGGYKELLKAILSPERSPDIGEDIHVTAGAIAIGAGGTTSGAEGIMIMLNIELRKDLAEAKRMRSSSHMPTRVKGYFFTIGAIITASLKSLIYSRSW